MTTSNPGDHLARLQSELKRMSDRIYELERRVTTRSKPRYALPELTDVSNTMAPTADQVLTWNGTSRKWTSATPAAGGGGTPSGTVVSETSFGQSPTAGAATAYSRGDHTHGTPTAPATQTIHSVAVYRSSNLTIGNAAESTVSPYTAARYDTSSMWDGVGLLVAPQTGTYLVWGSIMWQTNATGQRVLHLVVNGSTTIIDDHMLSGTNLVGPGQSAARAWRLSSGDNVRMNVLQESGGNLDILGASAHSAEFGMTWLGP